ncbi:hypothetical protein F4859DRAFT_518532 [Xylaria cf. heliscus]|nr:hypothetical protein F4859DRAFT_518532 [Xylaria cf. heliscus]
MQINVILGALFGVTASGAAVKSRSDFVYNISGLTGFCAPDVGHVCGYGFRVKPSTAAPDSQGPICGNIWPSTLVDGKDMFPTTPLVACEDASYSYSVTAADGGFTLSVTSALDSNTNITGSHVVTADQLTFERNNVGYTPSYIGPVNVTMQTVEVLV